MAAARQAAGLDRAELAQRTARDVATIRRLEADAPDAQDPQLVYDVARALDVDFQWLVMGREQPPPG